MATFGDVTITVQELVALLTDAWNRGEAEGFRVGLKVGKGESVPQMLSSVADVNEIVSKLIREKP